MAGAEIQGAAAGSVQTQQRDDAIRQLFPGQLPIPGDILHGLIRAFLQIAEAFLLAEGAKQHQGVVAADLLQHFQSFVGACPVKRFSPFADARRQVAGRGVIAKRALQFEYPAILGW